MAAPTTQVTATISRVNDHGFTTQEEPARWFNLSKWADPVPVIPAKGTEVKLTLDSSGYVRSIEPLDAPSNGHHPRQDAPTSAPTGALTRDQVITRLACLKAAAGFLSTREASKSTDVLAVAESFERWVTRA
jgi:hypothetical protein